MCARVFLRDRIDRPHDPSRRSTQLLYRNAERRQHVIPAGLDIAAKEFSLEPEPQRELKPDPQVRARLAHGLDHLRPQLDQRLRGSAVLKADAQTLALPSAVDRQQDIGKAAGRSFVKVALDVKLKLLERAKPAH